MAMFVFCELQIFLNVKWLRLVALQYGVASADYSGIAIFLVVAFDPKLERTTNKSLSDALGVYQRTNSVSGGRFLYSGYALVSFVFFPFCAATASSGWLESAAVAV